VKVKEARAEDVGFASTISFQTGLRSSDNNDFEYFIPSVLYRNTSEVREDAVAADLILTGVCKRNAYGTAAGYASGKDNRNYFNPHAL